MTFNMSVSIFEGYKRKIRQKNISKQFLAPNLLIVTIFSCWEKLSFSGAFLRGKLRQKKLVLLV